MIMAPRKAPKMCFDRLLPSQLTEEHRTLAQPGGRFRAIAPIHKQWINGSTLRIRFISGTTDQQDLVKRFAPTWTEFANLAFVFTDDPHAEIRVSFDENDGAWSYIGTDNSGIPLHAATLNLGWQDEAVVLHEFGHAIGFAHEHQNPEGGIVWNEENVIRDLSGPPNHWDEPTIRHNVLEKYAADQIIGTKFDPLSIMLYAFPGNWTRNLPQGTKENKVLSEQDKLFVQSEKMYPRGSSPSTNANDLPISSGVAANISKPGEENLFKFQAKKAGTHTIETSGSTDVVMTLFGPDSLTQKIAEDDDSGPGSNARIQVALHPGAYYVRVRHYDRERTGPYEIQVTGPAA
jgi:hypothetical protein